MGNDIYFNNGLKPKKLIIFSCKGLINHQFLFSWALINALITDVILSLVYAFKEQTS